jgi:tRNA(Arg) A34 adenosine deaminase TadA
VDDLPQSLPQSFREQAEHFMREALHDAERAGRDSEPPIGAVVVLDGQS